MFDKDSLWVGYILGLFTAGVVIGLVELIKEMI